MNIIKKTLGSVLLASTLIVGCSSDFVEGFSEDPSGLQQVNVSNLLTSAQQQSGWAQGDELARITEVFMQRAVGNGRQALSYNRYALTEGNASTDWGSNLYAGALKDLDIIIEKGSSQEANHYVGVAKVMMAMNLGYLTDLFGDIPYEECFDGDQNLSPKYDSQEEIYQSILELCDQAIVSLGKKGVASLDLSKFDKIYSGDVSKWVKLAHSVKARHLNHLSKLPQYDVTKVLSELSKSISSNDDNAYIRYENISTKANPWAQFNVDRTDVDYVTGTAFGVALESNNDPRLEVYKDMISTEKGFFGAYDSPLLLYTFHEMKFIESEAKFRNGDSVGAKASLEEAIKANMSMLGISEDKVASYVLAVPNVSLEVVMNEKYRALYTQYESWTDWRRTGFPSLAFNPTEGSTDIKEIPRRIPYPQSERLYNSNFIDLSSSENRTKRMWWDVN